MALFADFVALIIAAYVILRCVDIGFNWLYLGGKGSMVSEIARVAGSIITCVLAIIVFLWAVYWFVVMLGAMGEMAKGLR